MENCDDLLGSILDNELILLVPRGGIEPPTLRFSVLVAGMVGISRKFRKCISFIMLR